MYICGLMNNIVENNIEKNVVRETNMADLLDKQLIIMYSYAAVSVNRRSRDTQIPAIVE